MLITYSSNRLEKSLTNPRQMMATYGTRAKRVSQRMQDLLNAANLEVMRSIPQANCHELQGGGIAVDISANYRIVFVVRNNPRPLKEDGGLNWSLVTEIEIEAVVDYH